MYLDDIVLVGVQGGDGTVPLFTDIKSPNWHFWNTNTENRGVATPSHSDNAALAVDSLQGWNTMQLGHANSVAPPGQPLGRQSDLYLQLAERHLQYRLRLVL